MKTLTSILYLVMTLQTSCAQTGQNAKDLRTQLFVTDAYDNKVRAASNLAVPTDVFLDLYPMSLNSIDDVTETMSITAYLVVTWTDSFLQWTPASYGGINYTFFPQGDVWRPDIVLQNSKSSFSTFGTSDLNVMVKYDGTVSWSPVTVFLSYCHIDVRFFPYDVQHCELTFKAWSYTTSEVILKTGTVGVDLNEYRASPLWDIIDSSSFITLDDDSTVTIKLSLQRKPLFVILTLLFPVVLLAVLNICVFFIPSDSGEKSGFAVTIFLAFTVFLTIVEASMPRNSKSVGTFSVYIIMQTIQSTAITIIALALVRLSSFTDESTIPKCMTKLVSFTRVRKLEESPNNVIVPVKQNGKGAENLETMSYTTGDEDDEKVREQETKCTWRDVSNALDVICIVVFTSLFLISTVICLGYSSGVPK